MNDTQYTPMIEQYLEIKKQNPDAILFFRLGDFYEMFFDDARLASGELDIVLTAREAGGEKIPMCGVPFHSAHNYIARLINRGHKVAICEQVEDARKSKGLVKREVVRILTPGTVIDERILTAQQNNYLLALVDEEEQLGFSYIDISTGEFRAGELHEPGILDRLKSEIGRLDPVEILLPANSPYRMLLTEPGQPACTASISLIPDEILERDRAEKLLTEKYRVHTLEALGLKGYSSGIKAAAAIVGFYKHACKDDLKHIQRLQVYHPGRYMYLDYASRRNLEISASIREGNRKGSLLDLMDRCCTAMGKRKLKHILEQPLCDPDMIGLRQDAVQELVGQQSLRQEVRDSLRRMYDLERLAGKLGSQQANPRDLLAIKNTLAVLPQLKEVLSGCSSRLLLQAAEMDTVPRLYDLIHRGIAEEASAGIRDGGIIKDGYHTVVDELRDLVRQGKTWLLDFEKKEKERTGMKFLKIGFNKVFGYYIEISKSNLHLAPPDYIRKQTLVNTERFICEELKHYEDKILGAGEKLNELEYELFVELRQQAGEFIATLQQTASWLAYIDVFYSLAETAFRYDYVRPTLKPGGSTQIKSGRHPVVEQSLRHSRFVPNDVNLDRDRAFFAIITGPNMGGKSTYLRQTALIQILAQAGSFVPAESASLCLVDKIFTRVGAADDIVSGQSTFMAEMLELANILNNATRDSLILLDEIGRGTSTYDGLSIAQAACEYIHEHIKARTLFATHYHEITRLAGQKDGIVNLLVSVLEKEGDVIFLKKVLPGKADKSYGIQVGKLAGLPRQVISRAEAILNDLEQKEPREEKNFQQMNLFPGEEQQLARELKKINPDELTPRQALDFLYYLKGLSG